ncbi:hypothetical protein [Streptomyces celluloflavus]|uniref:Uncharacterized protein n=1 Tax=Streptomyces celluloflavus TaxID=58344 RepID=A0ABW7R7E9_9ACTN|nr:hypothetical protein OG717_16440 [Streptomyces celluloflavus]
MAHKITVPVHRARRALAAAIGRCAGGERRSVALTPVRHDTARTGPADLDLALGGASAARPVPAAGGATAGRRPAEVAAAPRTRRGTRRAMSAGSGAVRG